MFIPIGEMVVSFGQYSPYQQDSWFSEHSDRSRCIATFGSFFINLERLPDLCGLPHLSTCQALRVWFQQGFLQYTANTESLLRLLVSIVPGLPALSHAPPRFISVRKCMCYEKNHCPACFLPFKPCRAHQLSCGGRQMSYFTGGSGRFIQWVGIDDPMPQTSSLAGSIGRLPTCQFSQCEYHLAFSTSFQGSPRYIRILVPSFGAVSIGCHFI